MGAFWWAIYDQYCFCLTFSHCFGYLVPKIILENLVTKLRLRYWVFVVMGVYLIALLSGISLRILYPLEVDNVYSTFTDLVPFILAIPAAWLGFCFSKRLSFLSQLRVLWTHIVETVQTAIQYTHLAEPTREDYSAALRQISSSIDEVRGSFRNVGETNNAVGLYPFEELKDIYELISNLGYGDSFKECQTADCRKRIGKCWVKVRRPFLSEFERQEPSNPSSPYLR